MIWSVAITILLAAAPALAEEKLAVIAVADPPEGPSPALAEMAQQVRAACRERASGVEEVAEMRARLLGAAPGATLPELERAYQGALAAFEALKFESSARTLRAIIEDLEKLPESAEAYQQWIRAHLRLGAVERVQKHGAPARAAMARVAEMEPAYAVDFVQYPPSFLLEFEEVRRQVLARPRRKLTIDSTGEIGRAFVNGKYVGTTPVTLSLPAGRYRVGAERDGRRAPEIRVDLEEADRSLRVDVALAAALRIDRGPGLALAAENRAAGVVRAGAWLDVERLIALSTAQARESSFLDGAVTEGSSFLHGAIYDVRRGALLREGRVRVDGGGIPPGHAAALASFLLSGKPVSPVTPVDRKLVDLTPLAPGSGPGAVDVAARSPRPAWLRPAAFTAGAVALGLAGFATYEAISAGNANRSADAMLRPDGNFVPGVDRATYDRQRADASSAQTAAYMSAASAIVFAAAAGVLGYLSRDERWAPVVRF